MRRKLAFGALGTLFVLLLLGAGAFLVPWSSSCDTQRDEAGAAWRRYAETGPSAHRQRALAIASEVGSDLETALEAADALAPPAQDRGYRDAMERLALARSACR